MALASLGAIVVVPSLLQACSVPDTHYSSSPTGLAARPVPDPVYATSGAGDGGSVSVGNICEGGPPVGDPNCATKWSVDIYPQIKGGGNWKCADASCHGEPPTGGSGPNSPTINGDDPSRAWGQLVAFLETGKRYIDACSKTAENSGFLCNTTTPAGCGNHMPQAGNGIGAKDLTADETAKLTAWLVCGAPNN